LNLTAGQSINYFEVRLNYSNIYNPPFLPNGVLRASSIDYSSNMFSASYPSVAVACVDGIAVNNEHCAVDDELGQVHLSEFAQGSGVQGPVMSGLLFNIVFSVKNNWTSLFTFNRVNLINPSIDSTGPHPRLVQYVTRAGIFANKGFAAFFNAEPVSSPSILAGQPGVVFDATGSFDADNPGLSVKNYTWNFDDGNTSFRTQPRITHIFAVPGNYSVRLVAADELARGNLTITVRVMVNLGTLLLMVRDYQGSPLRGNVFVSIYNISRPASPFKNVTTNGAGSVTFTSLVPGSYYLNFSGPNVKGQRIVENVIGGWLQQDTVYIMVDTILPPTPLPNYSGLIYLSSILAFLTVLATGIVLKRRRDKEKRRFRGPRQRSA
jgi:hypothetical protein